MAAAAAVVEGEMKVRKQHKKRLAKMVTRDNPSLFHLLSRSAGRRCEKVSSSLFCSILRQEASEIGWHVNADLTCGTPLVPSLRAKKYIIQMLNGCNRGGNNFSKFQPVAPVSVVHSPASPLPHRANPLSSYAYWCVESGNPEGGERGDQEGHEADEAEGGDDDEDNDEEDDDVVDGDDNTEVFPANSKV